MSDWRKVYWRFQNRVLNAGQFHEGKKRPCLVALCVSVGVTAFGFACTLVYPVVMPGLPGTYSGFLPGICFMVLILVGLLCSLLSLLWCVGSLIVAILRYVHKHQPKHPNWSDFK